MRVGLGYDSHILDENKPLVLGGVQIPNAPGLKAHSDGDVLLHAIIDALFGAAALGDIGLHFPDTDEKYHNASSVELLKVAALEIANAGYKIVNVDSTLICEVVRLRPHIDCIREAISNNLNIPVSSISVKGKTNEGMDDVGKKKGIIAQAVVLLEEII